MSNNIAFRFVGKMAMDCSSIVYNTSTGNIPMLALDVGIKVLELTENIISYNEEKKRTDEIRKQVTYMKSSIDKAVEIEQKKAEEDLNILQEKLNEDLKFEKIELAKELDDYKKHIELNMSGFNYKYEEQKMINQLVLNNARRYKLILNKIEECINIANNYTKDQNNLLELHEEFRKAQMLYNKLITSIS